MSPSSKALSSVRARSGMPRDVWILTANAFFVAVGFGVMMPVLPVFAKNFGVSTFLASWVISAFALMRLVSAPFAAPLCRALGEKWALFVGTWIVALSSVAAGLAHDFWQLLVFRALGGIGSATFTVAAMTLLLRSVPAEVRGRASGFYNGGFLVGGMAGPAVGGIVSRISLQAPFFFYAATCMVGGLVCLFFLKTPRVARVPRGTKDPNAATLSEAFADSRYRAAALTGFAQGWQSFGVRSALVPVLVTETLLLKPEWTGYAMAISAVLQGLFLAPAGRWTDTIGRRPIMVAGGVITGLAALATPWAGNIWVLIVILSIYGIGSAMHATAPMASVGDAIQGRGGQPVAVYSMITDVGAIVGPLAGGWLADHAGLHWGFGVGGGLLLASAAYSLLMPGGTPQERREPEGLASDGLDA